MDITILLRLPDTADAWRRRLGTTIRAACLTLSFQKHLSRQTSSIVKTEADFITLWRAISAAHWEIHTVDNSVEGAIAAANQTGLPYEQALLIVQWMLARAKPE